MNPLWLIPLLAMLRGKAGMLTEPSVVLRTNHFCLLLTKETKGTDEFVRNSQREVNVSSVDLLKVGKVYV